MGTHPEHANSSISYQNPTPLSNKRSEVLRGYCGSGKPEEGRSPNGLNLKSSWAQLFITLGSTQLGKSSQWNRGR